MATLTSPSKTQAIVQLGEQERHVREGTREAIRLAMESQWELAAATNRALLEIAPQDAESANRLGRALLELGDLKGAKEAFTRSLSVAPGGGIARKNLERISGMASRRDDGAGGAGRPAGPQRIPVGAFIHDNTKAARVAVLDMADWARRSHVSTGTPVCLRTDGLLLTVCDASGSRVGTLPVTLGLRLARLMRGGNRYEGAVCANTPAGVVVLLREAYQHPSQRGSVSFPGRPGQAGTGVPPRRQPARLAPAADAVPAEPLRWLAGTDDDEATDHGLNAVLEDEAPVSPPFEAEGEQ